jgi:hypothetical protein
MQPKCRFAPRPSTARAFHPSVSSVCENTKERMLPRIDIPLTYPREMYILSKYPCPWKGFPIPYTREEKETDEGTAEDSSSRN